MDKEDENTNECSVSKTMGFGSVNYGTIKTTITVNDNSIATCTLKTIFFKKKPVVESTVDISSIAEISVTHFFSKGDALCGIILFVLCVFANVGLAIGVAAFLGFCAYGKLLHIKTKDNVELLIQTDIGDKKEVEKFFALVENRKNQLGIDFIINKSPNKDFKTIKLM